MVARRIMTALVLALLVSGLFTFWLSRKLSKPNKVEAAGLHYVAAAQNLDPGTLIAASSLKIVDWPSGSPLEGSFSKPEDVVNRTLLYPIASGQPILDRQLSSMGAGVGLSAKIPDGMRAISLRTDEVVGVAGFLLPGTHVDVLVTYHPNTGAEATTSIVLQDVQVLAAGQKMQPDPEGKATTANVVTLLVSPNDAERVTLASAQGTVHFVLRNGSDRQLVTDQSPKQSSVTPPAPHADSGAAKPVVAAPKPEKQGYVVRTMRGDKVTEEKFQ
jgi:pilus assembly protein CpaB